MTGYEVTHLVTCAFSSSRDVVIGWIWASRNSILASSCFLPPVDGPVHLATFFLSVSMVFLADLIASFSASSSLLN